MRLIIIIVTLVTLLCHCHSGCNAVDFLNGGNNIGTSGKFASIKFGWNEEIVVPIPSGANFMMSYCFDRIKDSAFVEISTEAGTGLMKQRWIAYSDNKCSSGEQPQEISGYSADFFGVYGSAFVQVRTL
jgi:hypothetical protein